MNRGKKFWICENHPEPVSVPIETVTSPSVHPFSDLCAALPTPIAFVLDEFFREGNAFVALWRMVDAAEIITRFFAITVLSDILRQKREFPEPVQDALTDKLERPTFGAWKELLAIAIDNLPKERGQPQCFVSELPSFVRDKWLPALGSGEDKPEEKLIALRNLIAHAGRLPDEKAQELLNAHRQRFESLAKELSFFANYNLIACPKEGQIVWLKGLPDADGTFPNYDRPLSFDPEHGRVYLVHEGEGLDLFPLHAFTDILQWREERYDFESLGEVAPQIYFRLSERGYLECIPFSNRAVVSYLGEDAYRCFREIFQLEEWRARRRQRAEAQGIQKLWDEQVRELTEVFVGREEHIRQVKDAIKRTSKGVLWISGKPGVGKSALMAELMRDYIGQTQHYIVIPYFFRSGQAGCSTMDFLATALKRLEAKLKRTIEPAPHLPDRQKQLVEALEEVVSKTSKKVLFLVDGLDEIYRQEREFLNVPFMTIRERIVWVCAGRSEGDLEEVLRSRGAEWVFPEGLPRLDEQATRAMLIEHLGRLKYALFERDEGERNRFIEAVADKSEGLPLYVRMVIEDLKAERLTVWDEDKLPEGLVAYYERLLERLRVSDVGTVLTPLFCLLAWAKEAVTERTMNFLLQTHHLAGTPRWGELFRRAFEHGHLMLQQRPTPENEAGWTIYHHSFRQHLLESGTVIDNREWAQERWLKVCEDWKVLASQEPSLHRCILRHYTEHLREAKRWDELFALARDDEFRQAQAQAFPADPDLPLRTVQAALLGAAERDDAGAMAEFLLTHARRLLEITQDSPLEVYDKEGLEQAWKMAELFEEDLDKRILWKLLLLWKHGSNSINRQSVKEHVDKLLRKQLPILQGDWQAECAAVILSHLDSGNKDQWLELVRNLLTDYPRSRLCNYLTRIGKLDDAKSVFRKIGHPVYKAKAGSEIARQLVLRNHGSAEIVGEARQFAVGRLWRVVKCEIACALGECGKFDSATEEASLIDGYDSWHWGAWLRAKAHLWIAIWQAKENLLAEARSSLSQMIAPIQGNAQSQLATLAVLLGESQSLDDNVIGKLRDALWEQYKDDDSPPVVEYLPQLLAGLDCLEWVAFHNGKDDVTETLAFDAASRHQARTPQAIADIALAWARIGEFDRAWKSTREIRWGELRAAVRADLIVQMIHNTVLKDHITNIRSPSERAQVLCALASEKAQNGQVDAAHGLLAEVLNFLRPSREPAVWQWGFPRILGEMAAALAVSGNKNLARKLLEEAWRFATESLLGKTKAWALCNLIKAELRGGLFQETHLSEAREAAKWEGSGKYGCEVMAELAMILANSASSVDDERKSMAKETYSEAIEWLKKIENRFDKVQSLAEVGWRLGSLSLSECQTIARKCLEDAEKFANEYGPALEEVALAWVKAKSLDDHLTNANKILNRIQNPKSKGNRVVAIIRALEGNLDSAFELASAISDEGEYSKTVRDLAVILITKNRVDDAIIASEWITKKRSERITEIAEALIESSTNKEVAKSYFKKLLGPASFYLDAVYRMIALLMRLYPADENVISQIKALLSEAVQLRPMGLGMNTQSDQRPDTTSFATEKAQ
jgi:DNA polymerase III delta prime subunit